MTRMSKKAERKNQSPKRCRFPSPKTGPLKDKLAKGYKELSNAIVGEESTKFFIGKVK
ncbi:MAG: hypothetical protein P0S94_04540 [Simkaniaceae bacterium]|nr:hypothetical protein [Simkaniaceae bacterium]